MAGFYVKRGSKEQGPFSAQDLKKFAAAGKIRESDKIRKENSQKYVSATKVKGLFDGVAAGRKTQPAKKKREEDYGGVEIIEDVAEVEYIDDDGSSDDFSDDYADAYGDDDFAGGGFDEYDDDAVVAYDDADEFDDYGVIEEDEPPRKRRSSSRKRSSGAGAPARKRSGGKKRGAKASAAKTKKPRKKKAADEEDEDEDGPWANLFYGVVCIAAGIFLFIALGEGSPDDWGNRGGLIKLVVKLIYAVGGRWAVLAIMILFGGVLFYAAYEKFQEQA